MRAKRIYLPELELISVLECYIEKSINNHGQAMISGYISEEKEVSLLKQDYRNYFVAIMIEGEQTGQVKKIFDGIVKNIRIESIGNLKKVVISFVGKTYLLDGEKRIRTFQDTSLTYDDLISKVNVMYENAFCILRYPDSQIGNMLVQYQETDWEFIKRVASNLSSVVIPYYQNQGICYYIGIEPQMPMELEIISYSETNAFDEYFYKKSNGLESVLPQDTQYIELVSRDFCDLGEMVLFQNRSLYVYSVRSEWKGSELIHTYHLKELNGFQVPQEYNSRIVGASLDGFILDIKNDTVKIQIESDKKQEISTAKWFPYSTVYSSSDGAGWYCMPEEGDRVRLYFPNEKEYEAYVISSVNVSGSEGTRSNPDNKSLSTKYGKTIELTPEAIIMSNSKGMVIKMDDKEGISIVSDKDVVIQSIENISITSADNGLSFQAVDSIELIQGNTKITLKDDVIIEGAKFKLE